MEVALPCKEPTSVAPAPLLAPRQRASSEELEQSVLRAAQAGDASALEALVRHYQRSVFAFISRAVGRGPHVDDLAQETFLRAIRALPRYEIRGAKFSTWLLQIAVRLIQDSHRKRKLLLVEHLEEFPREQLDPEHSYVLRRRIARLNTALQQVPEEQRMALALLEFHGLSVEEIADVMGSPVATVKTRVFRARAALRKLLTEDAPGPEVSND